MPWQTMPSARVAVTRGSFWRSEPAAALRGLANDRLAGLGHRLVEPLERLDRAGTPRRAPRAASGTGNSSVPVSRCGHRVDRLDVGGDVLAGAAVAAGERPDQPAVLVEQVDRQPVDLELAQQVGLLDAVAAEPGVPRLELLVGERVVEALHPLQVVDRGELGRDRAADLLGRRVRRAQLGELLLELLRAGAAAGRSRRRRASGRRARSSASGRPRSPRASRRCSSRASAGAGVSALEARRRRAHGHILPAAPTPVAGRRRARPRKNLRNLVASE